MLSRMQRLQELGLIITLFKKHKNYILAYLAAKHFVFLSNRETTPHPFGRLLFLSLNSFLIKTIFDDQKIYS